MGSRTRLLEETWGLTELLVAATVVVTAGEDSAGEDSDGEDSDGEDSDGGGGGGISDDDGGGGGEGSEDDGGGGGDSSDDDGGGGGDSEEDVTVVDARVFAVRIVGDDGEGDDDEGDEEDSGVMSQCSAPDPVSEATKLVMPAPTAELLPQVLALRYVSQELRPLGRLRV